MPQPTELMERPGCLAGIARLFGANPQPVPVINPTKVRTTTQVTAIQPQIREEIVNLPVEPTYPFRAKRFLLSKAEMSFYHVLKSAVQDKLVICPKMRLGDILYAETRDYKYWNQINQKHLDFLLCHPETLQPILGIELDDSSHQSEKAFKNDAFKNEALKAAGLPLLRVSVQRGYSPDDIRNQIRQAIKS